MKNQIQASIELTKLMNGKEKFAFLNIAKASIVSLSKKNDNNIPASFNKEIIRSINLNDKRIIKNVPDALADEIVNKKHSSIGMVDDGRFFTPNLFEYYYENNKEVYDAIFEFYVKNTNSVVISFHDKKTIYKFMGFKTNVINVSFNNYHNKLDETFEKLAALEGKVEYCIMDCSSLGLALSNSIWNKLDMSIIDLGKTISYSRTHSVAG
jgi:hypothetical protein